MADYDPIRRQLTTPAWEQLARTYVDEAVDAGYLETDDAPATSRALARALAVQQDYAPPGPEARDELGCDWSYSSTSAAWG
jgi:hypothetical protein